MIVWIYTFFSCLTFKEGFIRLQSSKLFSHKETFLHAALDTRGADGGISNVPSYECYSNIFQAYNPKSRAKVNENNPGSEFPSIFILSLSLKIIAESLVCLRFVVMRVEEE